MYPGSLQKQALSSHSVSWLCFQLSVTHKSRKCGGSKKHCRWIDQENYTRKNIEVTVFLVNLSQGGGTYGDTYVLPKEIQDNLFV